ncbi:hypothetical protein [Qingshengfaniella alkalisoli]|uniref:Uncharacterized protein n=1 Tax=Qingshengfaniella alkalisoli TaxID=2599296 RepID=A0A5B8IAK9_9RHOB|nr:hypothetical protein [Qingshengfaniella alkalisoli]QDY70346.1 hypothetical protein FPZ52_11430 [Qingshengfaniella alkalisoli]
MIQNETQGGGVVFGPGEGSAHAGGDPGGDVEKSPRIGAERIFRRAVDIEIMQRRVVIFDEGKRTVRERQGRGRVSRRRAAPAGISVQRGGLVHQRQ